MSAAFRRPRAEAPPVRISTGWVTDSHPLIWLMGIALCALAAFLYRGRNASVVLDCTAAGCSIQDSDGGDRTWLPRDGHYQFALMKSETANMDHGYTSTYYVRVTGTKEATLYADANSEESAKDLYDSLTDTFSASGGRADVHRAYPVAREDRGLTVLRRASLTPSVAHICGGRGAPHGGPGSWLATKKGLLITRGLLSSTPSGARSTVGA
jgi:hypothetical protein